MDPFSPVRGSLADRLRVVAERVSPLNRLDVVIAYHRETGAPGPAA
jgi:hypothetical protein